MRGGGKMEGRVDRLIKELVERVERLERIVLGKRLRGKKAEIGVRDLSERELELLGIFYEWARERWREWEVSYEEGRLEGYDRERGWILLKRRTMERFLDRVAGLGFKKVEALRLLADLRILRYWGRDNRRQYCIAVRMTKPLKGGRALSGYYVLIFERMRVVAQELRELIAGEESSEERQSEGERMEE